MERKNVEQDRGEEGEQRLRLGIHGGEETLVVLLRK
jgi:hypothetical protein